MSTSFLPGHEKLLFCFFELDWLASLNIELGRDTDSWLRRAPNITSVNVRWLLERLVRELAESNNPSTLMLESLTQCLAIEISQYREQVLAAQKLGTGGLPAWRMRKISDRVMSDGPMPTVTELADSVGITVRHLSRAFREETSQSLGDYIERAGAAPI